MMDEAVKLGVPYTFGTVATKSGLCMGVKIMRMLLVLLTVGVVSLVGVLQKPILHTLKKRNWISKA
eukprot:CAMPEP_0174273954 /NCGR_PEP_ID=MMETSP0439-20130205/56421_1 /TAXON_ID=0 /ORGANISM="Stereomyxa ramosa, Strain Chinc5" /LENGTH=65 /DNA_ID=CAMNT_0015365461 /DNA_START=154 /DNA_END=348 /DNA_ORIENTATION=-